MIEDRVEARGQVLCFIPAQRTGALKIKSNRFWIILLCAAAICFAVPAVVLWQVPISNARIYKDSIPITDTVNISAVSEPYTIIIEGPAETGGIAGFNVIEIDHRRIRMLESDCPDGYCVRQGWVSSGLVPIICLPNRVVITFESGNDDIGVDAVVG